MPDFFRRLDAAAGPIVIERPANMTDADIEALRAHWDRMLWLSPRSAIRYGRRLRLWMGWRRLWFWLRGKAVADA